MELWRDGIGRDRIIVAQISMSCLPPVGNRAQKLDFCQSETFRRFGPDALQ